MNSSNTCVVCRVLNGKSQLLAQDMNSSNTCVVCRVLDGVNQPLVLDVIFLLRRREAASVE